MIIVETRRDIVPATVLVPYYVQGEKSPVARRQRRARQLAEARMQPPVEVTTVTYEQPGSTVMHFVGQREPVIVNDVQQHHPNCRNTAQSSGECDCNEMHFWLAGRK